MSWSILSFLSLLCSFACIFAKVVVLTKDNFDSVVAENELVLVEFYAPWCGHCKKLEPEYDKAAEELKGLGPVLAKVDATVEKELGERFQIGGYPTLKVFRSGVHSPYESGRTAKDIVSFLKKQMGPAVKSLQTPAELEDSIPKDENDELVVVAFGEEGSNVAKFIAEYASKFRDDYEFACVNSPAVAGEHAMGTIVLFKPFDELKEVYAGELSEDEFSQFLKVSSMPAEQEISPVNYNQYMKRGLPIAWLFLDPDDDEGTQQALEAYKKVAPSFKDKLSLVHLDGMKYKQMTTKMGLSGNKFPALAIDRQGEHFVFPEGQAIEEEALRAWLQQFFAGELTPFMKSEPVPESLYDENNVATVVGDNFKEVVMDDAKDVLVEFYAPWCGHCKSLTPTWNQLGQRFKGSPSVVIAKTDATANDYPVGFQVSGFPTIQLVTSNGNRVVKFAGERTVEGFTQFLKENAGTAVETPSESEGDDEDDDDDEQDADNDEL